MWNTTELHPNERVVSYVFARYAGKKNVAWCKWDELVKRTGIKSKTTISKVINQLINKGWLKESEPARQHFSARYELTIPMSGDGGQTSTSWMSDRSRRTRAGRLRPAETAPDVQNLDVPDIQVLVPDIHLVDPSTQTEHSDLQPGGTLPPDPLRTERPQAVTRTDRIDPLTAVPDLNDTQQVTSKTRARIESTDRPLMTVIQGECAECGTLLDPDSSCFRCTTWTELAPTITQLTHPPSQETA